MKITLKRILICGMSFLGVIFMMIAMLLPITVWNMPGSDSATVICKASIWNNISEFAFNDAHEVVRATAATFESHSPNIEQAVVADNKLAHTMAIITLIVFFINLLAIVGAFFLKTNKGARKLIIPIYAVSAIFYFVATIIATGGLSYTHSVSGEMITFVGTDSSLGVVMLMIGISIVVFIAMLIVSGVVKEKEIATIGKK